MAYPSSKPRPNIVKQFVSRRARPIQGIAAARSLLARRRANVSLGEMDPAEGLGNWFTDLLNAGPKIDVPGVTEARDIVPVQYNAWLQQVMARGNQVTRMPSGANVGQYAERLINPVTKQPTGSFALAPQAVRDEDAKIQSMDKQMIQSGSAAAGTESVLQSLTPPSIISTVTGIPKWAIPVLLIGGGFMVLRSTLAKRA